MKRDREPVECFEYGSDMVEFLNPHQDPIRAVLNVLELLNALASDPING